MRLCAVSAVMMVRNLCTPAKFQKTRAAGEASMSSLRFEPVAANCSAAKRSAVRPAAATPYQPAGSSSWSFHGMARVDARAEPLPSALDTVSQVSSRGLGSAWLGRAWLGCARCLAIYQTSTAQHCAVFPVHRPHPSAPLALRRSCVGWLWAGQGRAPGMPLVCGGGWVRSPSVTNNPPYLTRPDHRRT